MEKDNETTIKNTDVRFLRLWDLYRGLLTDTQRDIADLYFDCDLSLGEIAEMKGVSRQGVSDCLHKCRLKLDAAEEKLHFAKLLDEESLAYSLYRTRVLRWADQQEKLHPEWQTALNELKKIKGSDEEMTIEITTENTTLPTTEITTVNTTVITTKTTTDDKKSEE
jgi:predicted DNA-binding protein YlxM (UPF0122 family)